MGQGDPRGGDQGGVVAPAGPVAAQPWPSKSVRVIVPWPPGGGTDEAPLLTPQELGQWLKKETARWAAIVKATGIRAE